MKKLIGVVVLSGLALCVGNNAFAALKGENICETTAKVLESKGYTKDAAYTAEGIRGLLKRSNIQIPTDIHLVDGQRYSLEYSCTIEKGLAYAQLTATPTDTSLAAPVTFIKWNATKPKNM